MELVNSNTTTTKAAKAAASSNSKASLVSRDNKVNKASLKAKVLVELVNSNTTTTKAAKAAASSNSKASLVSRDNKANKAVKADSSKVKADSKTKVTARVKATSNNKLEANRTKAMAKVKTNSNSSNNKVTAMATSHVLTAEARVTLTLTVKRHHTRLGARLRKTLLKKLAAKWLQLMQPNKLSQMQFRTPLRCLASQLRASSRAA